MKVLAWSGPSSWMTYSGTPRLCSAASSWREVFQSRPAPMADAASMSGSNRRWTTSAEVSMPALRWTAPITASTVSERIEALSRPPVASSPRPSLMYCPRPITRATSASARALTTAARSLASRPSERSGWSSVEGLGDDDAEHRVAEELEALVGRQAAVLVGEGPVRQGAVEQLGVELRIPEPPSEFLVVADGQVPGSGVLDQRTWRRSARAPYWPQVPQARCGRCFAPQAGLAQVTSVGATAFHCERRCRVLLRDIFRFGTATVFSSLVRSVWSFWSSG